VVGKAKSPRKARAPKPIKPTDIASVDALVGNEHPTIGDYVRAVSDYVVESGKPGRLSSGQSKTAQIQLSLALGRALTDELKARSPMINPVSGERKLAGALRTARADVSEAHELDGVRLAIEIKPINLAVGRAIWNRFGDVRAFAVNIHLKFPFAVVGAVLAVPVWEWVPQGKQDVQASETEPDDVTDIDDEAVETDEIVADELPDGTDDTKTLVHRTTEHLIARLVKRLARTRKRLSEADAAHLFEAVTVIVYDPDKGILDPDNPPPGSGLRWDEFVGALVDNYEVRFEE
jgi:hypothetical protein